MWWLKFSVVLVTVISISAAPTPFADEIDVRLPRTSKPLTYDLSLATNIHTGVRAYTGNVKIQVEITADTDSITLHSHDLAISRVTLMIDNADDGAELTIQTDTENDFLIVQLPNALAVAQQLTLDIDFSGNIRTDLVGFYRSSYVIGGSTR